MPIRTWSPGSAIRRNWSRNAAPTERGTSGGSPDVLEQPLAALAGRGYDKPVWHCAVRAAPEDRMLSDAEWAQVAARVMHRTGLAPDGDDLGVRWVAVRHAADHIHIVATLARQDGTRPRTWNDYYRVREACHDAERRFGLRPTAPADRTAARRPTRAETEQAARRGWAEPARVTLRREVCTAAAGAGSEQEFFARLRAAGVLVRERHSTVNPDQVTGYAVGLPGHTAREGGVVWYGGGKLAADLTLPKLRARWAGTAAGRAPFSGTGVPAAVVRGALRTMVTQAAEHAADEAGFFAAAARGRGAGAGAVQRDRSGTGHRVFRHPPRPHRAGRNTAVVRRRPARRRAHPAPAAGSLEPATGRRRNVPERLGSPPRNGTRSTGTRPAKPGPPRNTSAAAP